MLGQISVVKRVWEGQRMKERLDSIRTLLEERAEEQVQRDGKKKKGE